MPVSAMKFVVIVSPATRYHVLCFACGGSEPFFTEKGMSVPLGYIAGVVVGPNPALLMDTVFGSGRYAVERAGYFDADLMAAWEYITRHFDNIPEGDSVMTLERSAAAEYGWKVKEVA